MNKQKLLNVLLPRLLGFTDHDDCCSTRVTLRPDVKLHLTEGVYCVLDLCLEPDVKLLRAGLNAGVREVFNELYSNYTHYHKTQRQGEDKRRVKRSLAADGSRTLRPDVTHRTAGTSSLKLHSCTQCSSNPGPAQWLVSTSTILATGNISLLSLRASASQLFSSEGTDQLRSCCLDSNEAPLLLFKDQGTLCCYLVIQVELQPIRLQLKHLILGVCSGGVEVSAPHVWRASVLDAVVAVRLLVVRERPQWSVRYCK
ncbi:hypothetical protein CCH79_00010544 [Gambusia affinis]|uniref:Nucleolar 27S pre-rRNA processing Urb2/Npa2 C-terminal domain-containing protein n=1 Tax=Gambusia affinis TaxID=33528 RepID=A0A315V0K7_GAMAF|nr:hypothetical protein CCH79_00010544 [Gambusia affinis]